ncbi:uncharacterized protein FA14DRAFT_176569 [Meira miltonrushii]|uniref:RINT-1 family protein n=1 Tax=Meira miltonrushii TaxID=1280837 RepID=A0A316VIE0_9BASI|nr:uncharacterized protein FA14DRAFT_176569 [Meira miltonrushii]PWN37270.1 hypothetical protein FA14DRAFT_176569 [Meira miltonrushii]
MTSLASSSFENILVNHKKALQDTGPNYTDILRDPLLTSSRVLTSKELDIFLTNSHQAEKEAQAKAEESKRALSNSLSILLAHTDGKAEELNQLPDQIETLEDELAELCAELRGEGPSSSASLLQTLREKQTILEQLEATQDSLAILAKAEDLKDKAIKAETKNAEGEKSLVHFTELAALSKRVESLANGDSKSIKAIEFVNAQKSQAFTALAKARQDRLDSALKNAGWPPPPPELKLENEPVQQSPEKILLQSTEVRAAWRELMILQRKSEQIGVLRPSSARMSSTEDSATVDSSSQPSPGSKAYQPLLTVECLLKPLLLRFYYHFDSSRTTNRLDKPEWYLNHMLSILKSNMRLFDPFGGAIAVLCNNVSKSRKSLRYDLSAELLHGLLRPLTLKVESSIELLLQNSQLLSHTIMQTVQFDQDVRATLMPILPNCSPIYLADALLSNETVFEAWVQSERAFASDRLDEEMESKGAWLVGDEDGLEAEATDGSWSAMAQDGPSTAVNDVDDNDESSGSIRIKTTRSARAVISLIEGLTVRYKALPSISHQLPFLLIQLSVLQGYAQRLERSLDAFESLSSAFSRAIPGAISGGSGGPNESQGISGGEADMVRGLRGLGRLLKACLSALFISAHLSSLSSQSFFLIMGTSLANTREGEKLMGDFRKWEGDVEERELDQASLGDLVRRGWRSGGRLASGMRPLATNAPAGGPAAESSNPLEKTTQPIARGTNDGMVDVWEKSRDRFDTLAKRALRGIEKMITSEVLEGMRTYSQRDWNEDEANSAQEEEEGEQSIFDIPTPSLLSSLSTLSMHLSHMLPSLPRLQANTVYRAISDSLSTAVVERVVFSGGAHRFNLRGAQRFQQDVHHGWMGVVNDVSVKLVGANSTTSSPMGTRPQASWSYLLDAVKLLSLTDDDIEDAEKEKEVPTLQQACRAAFEPTMAGPSWEQVVEMLNIDDRMNLRVAREILRRRIECPW